MHRAQGSDWSKQPKESWNSWQKLAARTNGVVTPGNFISLFGGLLVVYGMYKLGQGALISGIIIIVLGRIADIGDGIIADMTGTKSRLGETVDATIDKLLLAAAVLVLLGYQLVPFLFWLIIFLHGLYNTCISALSVRRGIKLHPSETGKLGTAFEWLCIGFFLMEHASRNHNNQMAGNVFFALAVVCSVPFIILAVYSSYRYTQQLTPKAKNG